MDRTLSIAAFNNIVKRVNETEKYPLILFQKLKQQGLSRVELMIVDSAIKNMSLETLDKTLLLLPEEYSNILQKLTVSLTNITEK